MKLYAWQPVGHGPQSFFVMAETQEDAAKKVIQKTYELVGEGDIWGYKYARLFFSEHWNYTVAEVGEVLTNDNE